jgi:hypothetical protein
MRCHGHELDRRRLGEQTRPELERHRHQGHLLGVGHRSLGVGHPHHLDAVRLDEVRHLGHPDQDGLGRLSDEDRLDGCPDQDDPCPG